VNGKRPTLTRIELAKAAGFKAGTGTINRVLHGIPKGSSSGKPHKGIIDLKLVALIVVTVDGVAVTQYHLTPDGTKALKAFEAENDKPGKVKKASTCTNDRYAE
jgi:hypothetical protein